MHIPTAHLNWTCRLLHAAIKSIKGRSLKLISVGKRRLLPHMSKFWTCNFTDSDPGTQKKISRDQRLKKERCFALGPVFFPLKVSKTWIVRETHVWGQSRKEFVTIYRPSPRKVALCLKGQPSIISKEECNCYVTQATQSEGSHLLQRVRWVLFSCRSLGGNKDALRTIWDFQNTERETSDLMMCSQYCKKSQITRKVSRCCGFLSPHNSFIFNWKN